MLNVETAAADKKWTTITRNEKQSPPSRVALTSGATRKPRSPNDFKVLESVGEDITQEGLLIQETGKATPDDSKEEGELEVSESEEDVETGKRDCRNRTIPRATRSQSRSRGTKNI